MFQKALFNVISIYMNTTLIIHIVSNEFFMSMDVNTIMEKSYNWDHYYEPTSNKNIEPILKYFDEIKHYI